MINAYYERHKVTATLILINVMMGLVVLSSGGFTITNLISWGALNPYYVRVEGDWYRIVTSMLLHGSIFHLLMNMYVLYYIGGFMERILGPLKYTLMYLIAGVSASILVVFIGNVNAVTVGASGSIFGIMGGLFLMTYVKSSWLDPQTIRSIRLITGLNLVLTILIPSISVEGHFGGLIAGLILFYVLVDKEPYQRY
jgi:membrane associated rhomboid family serine protease